MYPLPPDNRSLNVDFWSGADTTGILAGAMALVLACLLLCVIVGTVCHAISEAGKAWLSDANGRRR